MAEDRRIGLTDVLRHIVTELAWQALELPAEQSAQLHALRDWLADPKTDKSDGRVVLFHGPSGTGKTLAAALLGKATGRPVLQIDLSRDVSRYIGETEKNLEELFDHAREERAILFFDEADALFGKRGKVPDAEDRHANIEVSYLLQRAKSFDGLLLLATRVMALDAETRRYFDVIVDFPHRDAH